MYRTRNPRAADNLCLSEALPRQVKVIGAGGAKFSLIIDLTEGMRSNNCSRVEAPDHPDGQTPGIVRRLW